MARKKQENKGLKKEEEVFLERKPWISYRSGIITISITSVVMAVLTAIEAVPSKGLIEGILYGILFGGLIWAIFLGFMLFNRLMRGS